MARRKQIEFQTLQGHDKRVEMGVVAFAVACVIFVIVCIQVVA